MDGAGLLEPHATRGDLARGRESLAEEGLVEKVLERLRSEELGEVARVEVVLDGCGPRARGGARLLGDAEVGLPTSASRWSTALIAWTPIEGRPGSAPRELVIAIRL